jgi:hypothetical protein
MAVRAIGAERSLSYFDRCVSCTASVDRYLRHCQHLEPNRTRTFMQRFQLIAYSIYVLTLTESPRAFVYGTMRTQRTSVSMSIVGAKRASAFHNRDTRNRARCA